MQPHHREQLAGCLVERHKGHSAGVIEMREILDQRMAQLAHRREKPHARVSALTAARNVP